MTGWLADYEIGLHSITRLIESNFVGHLRRSMELVIELNWLRKLFDNNIQRYSSKGLNRFIAKWLKKTMLKSFSDTCLFEVNVFGETEAETFWMTSNG